MKTKMTRSDLRSLPGKILSCSYCSLQNLLINHAPIAYNCGVYGWNWDAYRINGVTICTGCRNTIGKRIDFCDIVEYENRARRILDDYTIPFQTKQEQVEKLLAEFMKKVA